MQKSALTVGQVRIQVRSSVCNYLVILCQVNSLYKSRKYS